MTVADLLSDAKALWAFASKECSGWMAETLGTLLGHLGLLDSKHLGFELVQSSVISKIKRLGRKYRENINQHPPMPTSVYSHFIKELLAELNAWTQASHAVLPVLTACGADPCVGRSWPQQKEICKQSGVEPVRKPPFEEIAPAACTQYIERLRRQVQVKGLSYVVGEAQVVIKLVIQTFTGMREDEAESLPYDCVDQVTQGGIVQYVVKGRTTKHNHGLPKPAKWVTNHDGYRAIIAAKQIADSIYAVFGVNPQNRANGKRRPLFVSVGYANLASKEMLPNDGEFVPGKLTIRGDSDLHEKLSAVIREDDLRELEHVDPHRAWRSEAAFTLGKAWNFTTHQLRRSLALYAQRSGLVSLPSLRRQLQHITDGMARYYASGSAYARDFVGDDKDHFGREWQQTRPESAGLSFIRNVLMSEEKQFGGHAHWVKHTLTSPGGTVLASREATMKQFQRGQMAYEETALGGCARTSPCDKPGINHFGVECIRHSCAKLAGSLPKLEHVILIQEAFVSNLDPSSVEYRTENADLEVFRAARVAAMAA